MQMVSTLENQLAQLILYVGAITAVSEKAKASEGGHDPFLFGTVYDALWDAAIVRLGTLWDDTKSVASLPKLALELDREGSVESKDVARLIRSSANSERKCLMQWRHKVVAHAQYPFDPVAFDANYAINVRQLEAELASAEVILLAASQSIGMRPAYFEVMKSDAIENAQRSLTNWQF